MRRQHFAWTFLVLAAVLTIYGSYSLIYSSTHDKDTPVLGLIFFISGLVLLSIYFVLVIISYVQSKKKPVVVEDNKVEEKVEEVPQEVKVEENLTEEKDIAPVSVTLKKETTYRRPKNNFIYDSDDSVSGYIKKVGYGPVFRVNGNEILDMRSNTYYRIEGNMVNQLGSGPVFEISGNKIRLAFGGYLYEISGDNVNKVYGGYYASFSGGYLQVHDLSEKYEVISGLNTKQKLAIVALLFGTY